MVQVLRITRSSDHRAVVVVNPQIVRVHGSALWYRDDQGNEHATQDWITYSLKDETVAPTPEPEFETKVDIDPELGVSSTSANTASRVIAESMERRQRDLSR